MNEKSLRLLALCVLGVFSCKPPGDSPPPRRTVTGTFSGAIDAEAGTLTIWSDAPSTAGGGPSLASLIEIPVAQDGVPNQGPPDTVELVTAGTADVPLGCAPLDGFEGQIRLRSFYAGAVLANTHIEITSITPTGREACNSAPPFDPLSAAHGLWDYGTIGRAGTGFEAAQRTWRFRVPDRTRFVFRGRVMADLVTADPNPPTTIAVPGAGTYAGPQTVELVCADAETGCAATYYTTDGTEPTNESPVYGGPITVASSLTLRWFSVDFWGNAEAVSSAAYVLDATPPSVVSVTPAHGSVGVPVTTAVVVTFSEPVVPASVTSDTFSVEGPAGAVEGAISANGAGTVFTFTPAAPLQAEGRYTVRVTAGVTDLAGNALSPEFESVFHTPTARQVVQPSTSARILNHQLLYDWNGNGIAAWNAATQGGVALVFATYSRSSGSWSAARVLATERDGLTCRVRLVTDGTRFLLVWCTRSALKAVFVQNGIEGSIDDVATGAYVPDFTVSSYAANRFLLVGSYGSSVSGWSWNGSAWSTAASIGGGDTPVLAGSTVYYLGSDNTSVRASTYGTGWSAPVAVATTGGAEGSPTSLSVGWGTNTVLAFGTSVGRVWAATGTGTSFGSKRDLSGASSEASAPLVVAAAAYGSEYAVAWVAASGVARGSFMNGGTWPAAPSTLVSSGAANLSLSGFSYGFAAALTVYDAGTSTTSLWAVPSGGAYGSRTWASPILVESGAAVASEPGVAPVSTSAMLHWTQAETFTHQVMMRPYETALGAAQTPFVPAAVAGSPADVRLAANAAGDVLAVWAQDDGGSFTVFAALHTAAGWGAPVRVVTRAWVYALPDVASNGTDFLVVAVAESTTTPSTRRIVSIPVIAGVPGTVEEVATGLIGYPRVASDGQGYAAIWSRGVFIEGAIRSGGTWLATQALGDGVYPSLAGRAGEYLFVWQEMGTTTYVAQQRAAGAGASWTWEQPSWLGTYPYDAEVAAGPAGFFVAMRVANGSIWGWPVVGGVTGTTVRLGFSEEPCERLRVAASGGRYLVAWNCSDWLSTAETDGTVALAEVNHAASFYPAGYQQTALGFDVAGSETGGFRISYSHVTSQFTAARLFRRDSVAGSWNAATVVNAGTRPTQASVALRWDGGAYVAAWTQTSAASPIVDDLVTYWAF